jgi:hypothetical protein
MIPGASSDPDDLRSRRATGNLPARHTSGERLTAQFGSYSFSPQRSPIALDVLRNPWLRTTVTIFAILILIGSSLGSVRSSGGGNGPPGISSSATPYYPLLVSPSLFPTPDTAVSTSVNKTLSLPQLGSTGIGTNTIYVLVFASTAAAGSHPVTYRTSFYVSEGIFSASLAQDIAQNIPGRNLPINWSTPYNIGGFSVSGNCSSTALSVAPDGSSVVAGITCGSTSYIYLSSVTNIESSWTSLATPSGTALRLSLDPYGFAAATTIESGGTILVTTMPIPAGGVVSTTLGSGIDAAPAILRTQSGALEGVVASTPSSGVVFYYSSNDGRTFSSSTIGPLNDSNVSAVLNSVGSTLLNAPGGVLGQVAATTVGQNFFALYTVLQQGRMMATIYASSDDGLAWDGPIIFPLTAGAMLDPELLGTQIGYVYASWLVTAGTNLTTIQEAVFGPDGRVIQDPQSPPGGTGAWMIGDRPVVGMAVDSFQRPLFVWATPGATVGNSLIETGAFLSVANAASVAQQAVANVASPNIVSNGNSSTFSTGIARMVSGIESNASKASTLSYLDATRNQTAYLYQNLTITPLSYFGEQVSGSGQNTK